MPTSYTTLDSLTSCICTVVVKLSFNQLFSSRSRVLLYQYVLSADSRTAEVQLLRTLSLRLLIVRACVRQSTTNTRSWIAPIRSIDSTVYICTYVYIVLVIIRSIPNEYISHNCLQYAIEENDCTLRSTEFHRSVCTARNLQINLQFTEYITTKYQHSHRVRHIH